MANATFGSANSVRRKLALVIGIDNYSNGANISNARNDANKMSSALQRIGFIIHRNRPQLNLTYKEMHDTIIEFHNSIRVGDMVLFYFAGHGKQWEDQNYLIPSDDVIDAGKMKFALSGPDLVYHAINAQHLLRNITDRDPFVTIFFLDCCRMYHLRNENLIRHDGDEQNDYSGRFRTMPTNFGSMIINAGPMMMNARPTIANVGSIIAFACAPGTTADDGKKGEINGLFTKHILKHISKPNEDIRMMLTDVTNGVMEESKSTQIPYITCNLRHKNICLYEQPTVSSETRPVPRSEPPAQTYSRPSAYNGASRSQEKKGELFNTLMGMMMSPSRSPGGRWMDEDGYFNEDGSRSFS